MADVIPVKLHASGQALAEFEPTDSLAISQGGTGANNKIAAITNFISLINGQPNLVFTDTTRSKNLSVTLANYLFAEAKINNNEWMQIAHATDSDASYIMPFDGTIVGITAHCENTDGNSKPIRLYIDGSQDSVITTINTGTNVITRDMTLNIDFNQDARIRLRGGTGGIILDTVITLFVRWRLI